MANLSIFRHRFYKNDGTLNAGGKVYTYVPGTSTLRNTYTDSTAGTPNTNPIILDSKGEAAIWQTGKIKVNVLESDDTQVTGFPVDDIGYLIIADDIHAATNKTTPVDADEIGIWDSISEVLNRVTFANLWAYIQSKLAAPGAIGGTTPSTGNFTMITCTSVETSKATVASATTPDIFAAAGNLIDYTGTATCTGFVAASKAGLQRKLICADACLFTAGANLLIEGVSSGKTITLAANAIVDVVAITTTQFKITYSVSGTFTATGTGFTVNPTATANYTASNGLISIRIPRLSGTSNATTFTITGIPAAAVSSVATSYVQAFNGTDNGSYTDVVVALGTGTTITLYNGTVINPWTNSGAKQWEDGTIVFQF